MANKNFVSVNLTEPARDLLRQMTLDFTSSSGRRISMSDSLIAAVGLASAHRDEMVAALRGQADR